VITVSDYPEPQQIKRIEKLFAAADIAMPAKGKKIPIGDVDRALEVVESVSERLHIKSVLRSAGLVA
jgi:hypothetical protein